MAAVISTPRSRVGSHAQGCRKQAYIRTEGAVVVSGGGEGSGVDREEWVGDSSTCVRAVINDEQQGRRWYEAAWTVQRERAT